MQKLPLYLKGVTEIQARRLTMWLCLVLLCAAGTAVVVRADTIVNDVR
jgi:hypothetical protein